MHVITIIALFASIIMSSIVQWASLLASSFGDRLLFSALKQNLLLYRGVSKLRDLGPHSPWQRRFELAAGDWDTLGK